MAKTPRRKRASPKPYTEKRAREITERIASGESWLKISQDEEMPAYPTLYAWMRARPEFASRMAQARLVSADWKADKALEVAERGTPTLHVNTLMSQAAKIAPSRWGPRAGLDEEGASPKILVIRVRHFEKVAGPDGRLFVREVPPEPKDPAP